MKNKFLCILALTGIMSMSVMAAPKMAVDSNVIEDAEIVEQAGIKYFPVRPVAEALGLSIEWKAEDKSVVVTNGGPLYVTFKIGENAYTFAKTAPMPFSGAPVIIDSRTYIPVDIMSDLFAFDVMEKDDVINIVTKYQEEITEIPSVETTTEVTSDEETTVEATADESDKGFADLEENEKATGTVTDTDDEKITFEDAERGTVILTKGGDTKAYDKDGNEIDINTITVGMKLSVEYGPAMTMSIPPINNPVSVTVTE